MALRNSHRCTLSPMNRNRLSVVAVLVLLSVACSDSTGPTRGAGLYRLATVNGAPVPVSFPPSLALDPVYYGALYLRADGSFGLAFQVGVLQEGDWRLNGSTLVLEETYGAPISAELRGDSVTLVFATSPLRFVFRRLPGARDVISGAYPLTSMAGSTDLIYAYEFGGARYETIVDYDTIEFVDDVFFRRHRYQRSLMIFENDTSEAYLEFNVPGMYERAGSELILRHAFLVDGVPRADSLEIRQDTLERRSRWFDMASGYRDWVDLYTRRQ